MVIIMIKKLWDYIFYDNITVDRVEWHGERVTLECTYFPKAIKVFFRPKISTKDISYKAIYRYDVPHNTWYKGKTEVTDERLLRTLMSIFVDFIDCSKLTHAMFIEINQDYFK